MEERDLNSITICKSNTLEESLKFFDKSCLLEDLDKSLELVRIGKKTEQDHLNLLKTVDKDLLKLSQIHHPDKAIGEKKSVQEIADAQNLQTALNATRKVLKALTEVFLKDIDVHYKYEFFAKLDINTLINEKQIDLEINNVLCKISCFSEIKRVNIIGEIHIFLLKCQDCLESFRHDKKHDFVRYRDRAFQHLRKCIEGYEMLFKECELIVEECSAANDENTKRVVEKIYEQCQRESQFLQNLEIVAKRSLNGCFEIFPIYEPVCENPTEYEPVVPKDLEYFVSPFVFYVDVLLMCSVMVSKKSKWMKFKTKIGETFDNWMRYYYSDESINFTEEPELLKAYQLASYFNNKTHYREEVQAILKEKYSDISENDNIREAFKETLKEIENNLALKFHINSYKEGKSNQELFNERFFELKDSTSEFEEVEKNLLEKFKLYEQETNEIRKKYSELSEKIEKITNCANAMENISKIECNQNENAGNGMFDQKKAHENESYTDVQDIYTENKSVKNIEEH